MLGLLIHISVGVSVVGEGLNIHSLSSHTGHTTFEKTLQLIIFISIPFMGTHNHFALLFIMPFFIVELFKHAIDNLLILNLLKYILKIV